MPNAITTAVAMPSRKPISGWVVCPAAWAAVKKNSAVSRPSRPTASAAITTTAVEPILIAVSSLPRSSLAMVRAVRFIQKIIQVTKPTAMIDKLPPSASWASNVRACWVRASPTVTPTLTAIARPTPIHTLGSTARRPRLDQERDQDADHQGRLQPLAQPDQEIAEHRVSLVVARLRPASTVAG